MWSLVRDRSPSTRVVSRVAATACLLAAAAVLTPGVPVLTAPAQAAPPALTQVSLPGFDNDMSSRIARVNAYLAGRPGVAGYVLRDRQTGGIYASEHAENQVWTASTIKLAIAADLLNRARVGAIGLAPEDRTNIEAMLATSNDAATNVLWNKFIGFDRMAYNNAFRAYGMVSLIPQPTMSAMFPDWSFQKCTAADLDRLMNTILDTMHPDDLAYLLDRMRTVDSNQHWGVWGAGSRMRPGLKNGWSAEADGWVVNSVGVAGNGERYTLAIMNALGAEGGYTEGAETDTKVAELLLAGR
ncbi:tat pathway signal sequence [Nocardia sp. NPDC057663]|uniref:tat pathway signal sequence n=1 Tax=Nocardia sp. NPDC057663 TaxID=3346201 RepID=UPI0036708DD0